MTVTLIAAVGRNRVIGRDNAMPWHISEDLRFFKSATMGHTIIMGRKTFDAIGRPLPGRRTIVITRQKDWHHASVEVAHSFPEALGLAGPTEVFVIGGADIYAEAIPFADRMLLTEVDQSPVGDVSFPDFDPAVWRVSAREPRDGFTFVTYTRQRP